ncbi:acetoacetate--CoA ligase [Aurantimicrobium minutum]|uniref:acetoacetate--CoA ligase n=1 Tax=Aurantimicrobium minutum TaxID=708131 RepID=UPI002473957F|nr:acetoacetate--CoA ligase [Aurantimicrobium minutum]MDH6537168.1 acetoacetyl-CoA synthetase [Aurantimicrobium minutum]
MSTALGTELRPALPRDKWNTTEMGRFLEKIEAAHGVHFDTYDQAWAWSVANLEDFWQSIWDHFEIMSHAPHTAVLGKKTMPGAEWFPGARLNFAEHIHRALVQHADAPILINRSQTTGSSEWTGQRLLDEIAAQRAGLIAQGIGEGDRVVGYLPNIPQTVALYFAVASLGAIWCSVPPEMGPQSVLDRIEQLEPSLMIAIDGYKWGAKEVSRTEELARIRAALPAMKVVLLPYLNQNCEIPAGVTAYAEFTKNTATMEFVPVAFDHPLVILFSSGTTGKPKAIVHCHGGLLLEHYKDIALQFDISDRDRTFWYSTTGWMVWTLSVSSLLVGAAMVIMDGDPGWPALDGEWSQWAVLAETKSTYLTTGSAYLAVCAHSGLTPGKTWDLSRLREIQCSGSPLAADVAGWVYEEVNSDLVLAPASGGTDICSGFVCGSPLSPVNAGEMAVRPLGAAVYSWGPDGQEVFGEPGELVCVAPLPSMPAFFWGDQNYERYTSSYFDTWPGIWRHGDWLIHTERNTWAITGRSDATLNRGGVRLGTAEFYAILDPRPELKDSLVLHFEDPDGGMGVLALLAVANADLDHAVAEKELKTFIRTELSPRHVPDVIVWVPSVPRTATGKRLEIPLKRLVQGIDTGNTIDRGVLVHPEDLDGIVAALKGVLK